MAPPDEVDPDLQGTPPNSPPPEEHEPQHHHQPYYHHLPPPQYQVRPPALSGIKPPKALVTDSRVIAGSWKNFKQSWRYYETLTRTAEQPQEFQVALLLHSLGEDAQRIYNGLQFTTGEEQRTVDDIITAVDAFAVGELNETYERFNFNNRSQQEGEQFEQFLSTLR
jgi:hypothetical protein